MLDAGVRIDGGERLCMSQVSERRSSVSTSRKGLVHLVVGAVELLDDVVQQ